MYEDARRVIGPKRTLEILDLIAQQGTINFSDIGISVDTSSAVISSSLETLVAYGLVERIEESQRDVRYSITIDGERLLEEVAAIDAFLSQ